MMSMKAFRTLLALALILETAGCVSLATNAYMKVSGGDYLPASELDLTRVLPAPPADDSATSRAELETMLQLQAGRTADDCARAQRDADIEPDQFRAALGIAPSASLVSAPAARELFRRMRVVEVSTVARAKHFFDRTRPYRVEPRLAPCISLPGDDSYPSGHATWAYMMATVLAEMFPARRAGIIERARQFAHSRVVGGVHFPGDVEAGRLAGESIARKLMTSSEFMRDVAHARDALSGLVAP